MRLIDADALDKFLDAAEKEATKNRKYVLASAINTIRGNIRNFPSAEPEQKWIPCSERLPEKFRRVLCTIQDGEQLYVSLGAFIRHTDAPGNPDFRVVAWIPLPEEPYKEEE